MAAIAPFIQSVRLPVMPEVAHALIRTLNDEDADMISVRNIIAKDPALTATLLRMANSAMFGLSRTVTTLDAAVNVVGMSQIRARALGICVAQVFTMPEGLNRLEFWRYCMVSAGYARWIAGQVKVDEHQAWLSGMLLRLGELLIGLNSQATLQYIEKPPCSAGERWERERKLLGFDEGDITAEVAHRWDFPDEVVQALRASGKPVGSTSGTRMSAVLNLAGRLADQFVANQPPLEGVPPELLAALGLDAEVLKSKLPDAETFSDVSMLQAV